LQPGASKRISITVPMRALSYWNQSAGGWATATGTYGIAVGNTSGSPQLTGTLNVASTTTGNTVTVSGPAGMSSTVGAGASLAPHATDSSAGQTLRWTATGLPAGLAIDSATGTVSGTATTAGTTTVTVTATDSTGATGSTTFVWTTTPAGGPGGPVVSGLSPTLCLDVQAASTANGTPVQTWTCNGPNAQQWALGTDGTLRALGKCLDVTAAGTANGTKVQLYDCNATGAQVWQHQPNGAFLNPASNRCLDVPAASTTAGTRLQIYDCNATPAQQWTPTG
jgi:beta-glucosidase